jgi:hypothetical protein
VFRPTTRAEVRQASLDFIERNSAVGLENVRVNAKLTIIDTVSRSMMATRTIATVVGHPPTPPELEAIVDAALKEWARTPIGKDKVAIHIAATAEFCLGRYALRSLRGRVSAAIWKEGRTRYQEIRQPMRLLLRTMYELTQDELREAGIHEIAVYRGLEHVPRGRLPAWLRSHPSGRGPVEMQPISSFSASENVALFFAGHSGGADDNSVVLTATVPVGRILSCARTGFGALHEYEYVVLQTDGDVAARKR